MKVKDLIREKIDIDVIDDYDGRCWIAKCGAYKLTDAGEQMFHRVLDVEVKIGQVGAQQIAVLHTETEREANECKEFFLSLAGYCAADDYDRWFVEV